VCRRRAVGPSVLILFLLCVAALSQQSDSTSLLGRTITSVALASDDVPIPEAKENQLKKRLPQPSEKLTRTVMRNAVQALYSTLEFSDVRLDAQPDGEEGVRLTFRTKTNLFVGALRAVGAPRPPTEAQIVNATKLQLGNLFNPDDVTAGVENIKRLMAENGYYKSQIVVAQDQQLTDKLVHITFQVDHGPRASVGRVNILGDPGFSEEEVRNIAKMHPSDPVSASRVNRALTRLRKKYQKKDRLEAQVTIVNREYRPESDKVDYTFRIDRGDKVDIRVEGAKMRKGLIKKYVPVYEENAIDDDLLNEGRRNLRDYFQSKGFFDVAVDYRKD
jgi:outer membrane protein insertion porin family